MYYHQRITHTLITDTEREVELTFEPYLRDDILVHETPDYTLVAYLALDFDPENPMEAFDGQGALRDKGTREREGRGSDTDTDPFRVPVYWCDSAHGPGTATFHLTDSAETANKFWFPDECAEQNIRAQEGGDEGIPERARQYAKGVLEEYRRYCNGDVYGVVVELFDRQGERIEEDSVWGHYGYDYAKQALKEAFESKQKFVANIGHPELAPERGKGPAFEQLLVEKGD